MKLLLIPLLIFLSSCSSYRYGTSARDACHIHAYKQNRNRYPKPNFRVIGNNFRTLKFEAAKDWDKHHKPWYACRNDESIETGPFGIVIAKRYYGYFEQTENERLNGKWGTILKKKFYYPT